MKILNLSLLLLATGAFAQNIELKWAEKIKTNESISILGGKDGNFYTRYRNKDKNMVCRLYDKDLHLKDERVVSFNIETDKFQYVDGYFLNDKIVHVVKENIRKEDKNYLYGTITDLNLKTGEKTIILDEAKDNAVEFGSRAISPDDSKMVFYHVTKAQKNTPSFLNFKVYDSALKDVLMEKSVDISSISKNFTTESVKIDNLGNVYVLGLVYKEKTEKSKGEASSYYKVIAFNDTDSPKEFDFDYVDKDIQSIRIVPGENNTLICSGFLKILNKGFFGKGKKVLVSDEMFSATIDCKTLTLKSANRYFVEGLYPEKMKNGDYIPYYVRNIYHNANGSSVVVAEQYKLIIVTHHTKYGSYTTYEYHYGDIAAININDKSEVVSVSKMPKYQLNADNPSIVCTQVNGTTYIVYEDLAKNMTAENDKQTKICKGSSIWTSRNKNALFLLTVAPTGEMKKEMIYNYKESKIRPQMLGSTVVGKNEIVLNAKDQIGVLTISNKG